MFAKAPRFPPEKPSEIPGPNTYNTQIEESRLEAYKKGAFLEKASRFAEKVSDIPGPGTYNVGPRDSNPRPNLHKLQKNDLGPTHLQQQIENLTAQNTRLLREHQQTIRKYEEKITHSESTIKSLVKDNVTLQSQLSTQQKEHRSACQREAALRTALEKAEAGTKGEANRANKLAGLQRKLQDLERLHCDDKKRHQAELEKLKYELDANRKTAAEQTERAAVLRKQQDVLESRSKDLKKAIIADQMEIKELRMKAQTADQATSQAASRLDEVEQLKKTLQNLETKHIAELLSRDSKLAQLEKTVAFQSKEKDLLERQINDVSFRAELAAKEAQNHHQNLQKELECLMRSAGEKDSIAAENEQYIRNIQSTMVRVAEAYGHLATSSASSDAYRQKELQCASLHLRNIRLERRLRDREALVEQLTDYCRQSSEERSLLIKLLREAEDDQRTLLNTRYLDDDVQNGDASLLSRLFDAHIALMQWDDITRIAELNFTQTMGCFYETQLDDLLAAYMTVHQENEEWCATTGRLVDNHDRLQGDLDVLQLKYKTVEVELSRKSVELSEVQAQGQALEERLAVHRQEIEKLEAALHKERDQTRRLAQASHQSRKNEEHLRSDIDELVESVADLMRYKEAHADLISEFVDLIQRNELAEAEAEQLAKFNAEILGHKNPQQKIFYIDKIRRELADTKQQLLKSTRDREDLVADNEALQHEVASYKSIAIPIEQKPRSTRVRIERPPLATRHVNEMSPSITFEITLPPQELISTPPMTVDEIM